MQLFSKRVSCQPTSCVHAIKLQSTQEFVFFAFIPSMVTCCPPDTLLLHKANIFSDIYCRIECCPAITACCLFLC